MAVFGYVIYMLITIWVSIFSLAVFSWPSNHKGEKWFMLVIFCLFWYGAYAGAPFKMVSA